MFGGSDRPKAEQKGSTSALQTSYQHRAMSTSHSDCAGQLPGHQLGSQHGSLSQNQMKDTQGTAYEPTGQVTNLRVLHTEYLEKQAQKCCSPPTVFKLKTSLSPVISITGVWSLLGRLCVRDPFHADVLAFPMQLRRHACPLQAGTFHEAARSCWNTLCEAPCTHGRNSFSIS